MNGISIRQVAEKDIPEIAELEKKVSDSSWTEGMLRSSVSLGALIWAVQQNGEIIGYSVLDTRVFGEAEIHNIVVSPEHRGKGLSKLLMDRMILAAKESGAEKIFLEVREGNAVAIGLYKRYGFTENGRRRAYYKNPTEDARLMELLLE
jgi:ribosomal-protein-alanine N-acetyltransferase